MPRHRRLNMPGAINHAITRGLNRQDIFFDDCDRNDFLGRLEKNLIWGTLFLNELAR